MASRSTLPPGLSRLGSTTARLFSRCDGLASDIGPHYPRFCGAPATGLAPHAYSREHQERNARHDRCYNHTPPEQVRSARSSQTPRGHCSEASDVLEYSRFRVCELLNPRAGRVLVTDALALEVLGAAKRTRGSPCCKLVG